MSLDSACRAQGITGRPRKNSRSSKSLCNCSRCSGVHVSTFSEVICFFVRNTRCCRREKRTGEMGGTMLSFSRSRRKFRLSHGRTGPRYGRSSVRGNRTRFNSDYHIPQICVEAALREREGQVSGPSGAAARLGVPGSTLESKIRSLKISKKRFKSTNLSTDRI